MASRKGREDATGQEQPGWRLCAAWNARLEDDQKRTMVLHRVDPETTAAARQEVVPAKVGARIRPEKERGDAIALSLKANEGECAIKRYS